MRENRIDRDFPKAGQKMSPESVAARIAYARGIANNKDALLMQCAGLCTECGASLITGKRGDGIPVYEIFPIDSDVSSYGLDDFVVMCPCRCVRVSENWFFEDTSHQQIQVRNPVLIRDKVSEDGELCREITDSVSSYYPFIAFDKRGSYSEKTRRIIDDHTVVSLNADGRALYGRRWNRIEEQGES